MAITCQHPIGVGAAPMVLHAVVCCSPVASRNPTQMAASLFSVMSNIVHRKRHQPAHQAVVVFLQPDLRRRIMGIDATQCRVASRHVDIVVLVFGADVVGACTTRLGHVTFVPCKLKHTTGSPGSYAPHRATKQQTGAQRAANRAHATTRGSHCGNPHASTSRLATQPVCQDAACFLHISTVFLTCAMGTGFACPCFCWCSTCRGYTSTTSAHRAYVRAIPQR